MNFMAVTESETLRKLSPEEIQFYHDYGYLKVDGVFPPEELASIDSELSRLREDPEQKDDSDDNFILRLGLRSRLTRSLCQDERLLALIEKLVTPGIAIYSSKMMEKQPFDKKVCHWHQDDAYYRENSECDCRMSIWLPLQDCDESNGCLWIVPESHKWGLKEASTRDNGNCRKAFADGHDPMDGAISVPIRAGSVVLFHALTWHRSLGNHSDQRRRAFIISYQDALTPRGNKDQHKILRPVDSADTHYPDPSG